VPEARRLNCQARGVETPSRQRRAAQDKQLTNRKRRCPPMPSRYLYRPHVRPFGDRPPLRDTLTGGRPPGRKLPDPYWGGLAIIGRNEAKCRPSGFSSENVILRLFKAAPNHERTRG
jgi:hypothetical protein